MAALLPLAPPESASKVCTSGGGRGQMRSCSPCGPPSPEAQVVNARLVEELRSVVVMNDKWQKYHQQQKEYILELQGSLDEQRSRTREAEDQCSHLKAARQLQAEEIRSLEETNRCLSSEMREVCQDKKSLEVEVRELRKSRQSGGQEQDRNHLLQLQLQVCIEDFKKEEEEKLKLQKECSSLLSKLTEANRLLREYKEKVGMVQAIHFPSIGQEAEGTDATTKANLGLPRRRHRVSQPTPTRPCRTDGILDFPSSIEADAHRRPQRSFELAPKFSSSLGSSEAAVSEDYYSDHDSLETQYDLVRH